MLRTNCGGYSAKNNKAANRNPPQHFAAKQAKPAPSDKAKLPAVAYT